MPALLATIYVGPPRRGAGRRRGDARALAAAVPGLREGRQDGRDLRRRASSASRRSWAGSASLVWLVAFALFRYASVASIVAALSLPVVRRLAGGALAGDRLRGAGRAGGDRPAPAEHQPPARGHRDALRICAASPPRPPSNTVRPVSIATIGQSTVTGQLRLSHSRSSVWRSAAAPPLELRAQLARRAVALGDHVVRVDRLQVHLPREQEVGVVELGVGRRACRAGRSAPSPRRSAAAGARARRRTARRAASAARRPASSSSPRRSATSSSALTGASVPTNSVPRPRWLCVASGTSSRIRSTSSSSKPASPSRSAARSRTSPCAHGQALIPFASTPTSRRVPQLGGGREADQRDHLLRRRPVTGVSRSSG